MSNQTNETKKRILEATWHLMEQRRGQNVSMSDIAKAAGISRQAVYLHFANRTDLMIATSAYVDEVKGLNERLNQFEEATSGIELLEMCVEIWGNYIPEIYGLAKALLSVRETDEAAAAAWDGSMQCLKDVCRETIAALERDRILSPAWSRQEALEIFLIMISIQNWEQFTIEFGWSNDQYIGHIKRILKQTLIQTNP